MQFYLYSSQDLIINSEVFVDLKAGNIYCLKLKQNENIIIYSTHTSGSLIINLSILQSQQHNQIVFHKLSNQAVLCEIKPFIIQGYERCYKIKEGELKLISNNNFAYIYFNGVYGGNMYADEMKIKFEKLDKNGQEYGLITLDGKDKQMILFNNQKLIFYGTYIDSEILKNYIQIYCHTPNIFNIGKLVKYDFINQTIQTKSVCDRGDERKQINYTFNIIYFLEAIKCGRFKYAYGKLSYELKSIIDINTLRMYFSEFDQYIYLHEQRAYITLKSNKIVGVYHFEINDNLINNIY